MTETNPPAVPTAERRQLIDLIRSRRHELDESWQIADAILEAGYRLAVAVPDTGQADEVLKLRWEVQQLQGVVQDQHRAIAAVRSLCADAMKLPTLEDPRPADDRVSPRAVLAALDRAGSVPDTGQAREPSADLLAAARAWALWIDEGHGSTINHVTGPIYDAVMRLEHESGDIVQAPDVTARLRAAATAGQDALPATGHLTDLDIAAAWEPALSALVDLADVLTPPHDVVASAVIRVLLGTDTTPDQLAWISEAGETAAAEPQARYQETACARRPAEERPDA